MYRGEDATEQPFEGNLGLASVRQIAYELHETLARR
jgi:hypothetical protein